MGLFEGIRKARAKGDLSLQEAIVTVLLGGVYSDEYDSQEEMLVLRQTLAKSPIFVDSDDISDQAMIRRCKADLDNNPESLAAARAAVPEHLRATAFAMAVEIVFADGIIDPREATYINQLQNELGLDETKARAIVDTFDTLYRAP